MDRLKASVNKVIAANRMYRFHEEEEFNEYSYVEGEEVGEEVESDWLEVANHMDTGKLYSIDLPPETCVVLALTCFDSRVIFY